MAGAENVPAGPAVFAANHASVLDIPVLFGHLPADFRIIHKRSLYALPVIGLYLYLGGPRRHRPRATPSAPGAASRARPGASRAATAWRSSRRAPAAATRACCPSRRAASSSPCEAGVPVVPVSLTGVKRLAPHGLLRLRSGAVRSHRPPADRHRRARARRRGRAGRARRAAWSARGARGHDAPAARGPAAGRRSRRWRRRRRGPASPRPPSCAASIDRIVSRPALGPRLVGDRGAQPAHAARVLYARDAEKNFKPASTLKLVTTAAALDALGPDAASAHDGGDGGPPRRAAAASSATSTWSGAGDPNLSGRFHSGRATAALEELADALQQAGVRRIEGRLVGHEGLFQGERRGEDWAWSDLVWALRGRGLRALLQRQRRPAHRQPPASARATRWSSTATRPRRTTRSSPRPSPRPRARAAELVLRTDPGLEPLPAVRQPAPAAASPGRGASPSPTPRVTPPPSSPRSLAARGIRVTGAGRHLVRSAARRHCACWPRARASRCRRS